MRTASAKRRGRGGHNRREDVERFPSGGINYEAERRKQSNRQCAEAARIRIHGVAANDAASQEAGSVFGRLYLQGELGARSTDRKKTGPAEEVYQAGLEFARRRAAYLQAISSPKPTRSGSDIGYVHEKLEASADDAVRLSLSDPHAHAEWCERARSRYAEVRRACLETDPFALMAMETIISDDRMVDALVGPLRVGCNAIARLLRHGKRG